VIGRVYRGGRVIGLVRYLYGPGRTGSSVQHADPHLVGSWLGAGPATLAALEPVLIQGGRSAGRLDVEHLVRALEMPLGFADRPVRDPVWHCTLRNAAGDRALSDAESGQVAADVMHRTGPPRRTAARCGCGMTSCGCGRAAWPRSGATA